MLGTLPPCPPVYTRIIPREKGHGVRSYASVHTPCKVTTVLYFIEYGTSFFFTKKLAMKNGSGDTYTLILNLGTG